MNVVERRCVSDRVDGCLCIHMVRTCLAQDSNLLSRPSFRAVLPFLPGVTMESTEQHPHTIHDTLSSRTHHHKHPHTIHDTLSSRTHHHKTSLRVSLLRQVCPSLPTASLNVPIYVRIRSIKTSIFTSLPSSSNRRTHSIVVIPSCRPVPSPSIHC